MGVTIDVPELLGALRMGSTPEETAQATRLLAFAKVAVEKHAPGAPEIILNECVCLVAGYIHDSPMAAKGASFAAVMRNCGASGLMLPWRVHRAGSTAGAGRG